MVKNTHKVRYFPTQTDDYASQLNERDVYNEDGDGLPFFHEWGLFYGDPEKYWVRLCGIKCMRACTDIPVR